MRKILSVLIVAAILLFCKCAKSKEQHIDIPSQTPFSHIAENTIDSRPWIYYPLAQNVDFLDGLLKSHSYWRTERSASGYIIAENIYMYHEQLMIGGADDEFIKIEDDSIYSYQLFKSPLGNSVNEDVRKWKKEYILFCTEDKIAIAYEDRNILQNGEEFLFTILKPATPQEWRDFQNCNK